MDDKCYVSTFVVVAIIIINVDEMEKLKTANFEEEEKRRVSRRLPSSLKYKIIKGWKCEKKLLNWKTISEAELTRFCNRLNSINGAIFKDGLWEVKDIHTVLLSDLGLV